MGKSRKDSDLEALLASHNREDLQWWQSGQMWRQFRERHSLSQKQLVKILPDISLNILKKIETGSKLAEYPELVTIIAATRLGCKSAGDVMKIPGAAGNWKIFLEAIQRHKFRVAEIDAYTKSLSRLVVPSNFLDDLLRRVLDEKISVDEVEAAVSEDVARGQLFSLPEKNGPSHKAPVPLQIAAGKSSETSDATGDSPGSDRQVLCIEQPQAAERTAAPVEDRSAIKPITSVAGAAAQEAETCQDVAESNTDTTSENASKYIQMLEDLNNNLPDVARRLDELDEKHAYAILGDTLFKSSAKFIATARKIYPIWSG